MWRHSAKPARIGLGFVKLDARLVVFFLIFLFHMRKWTAIMAGIFVLIFWIIEKFGMTMEAVFRVIRVWIGGPRRVAVREWVARIQYFWG